MQYIHLKVLAFSCTGFPLFLLITAWLSIRRQSITKVIAAYKSNTDWYSLKIKTKIQIVLLKHVHPLIVCNIVAHYDVMA